MKKLLVFFAVLPFVFISCNKGIEVDVEPQQIAFNVDADFFVETKAVSPVTSLNEVNVVATTTSGSNEALVSTFAESTSQNYRVFTKQTSGTYSGKYIGGRYWPDSDASYHFYVSNAPITFNASGSTVAPTGTSSGTTTDIVCCYKATTSHKAVNDISLAHIFGRINTCVCSSKSGGILSDVSIKITPKFPASSGTTYNMKTGQGKTDGTGWSGTTNGSAKELANSNGSSKSNDFLLCPGSYTLTATWTTTKPGGYTKTFTNKTSAAFTVEAGKITNLSLSLPDDGQEIVLNVSIASWGSGVTLSPNITI